MFLMRHVSHEQGAKCSTKLSMHAFSCFFFFTDQGRSAHDDELRMAGLHLPDQ